MKQAVAQKPKRLKRVFPNHDEVIHRWANQTQEDARCKNVFFRGESIYSYGHHYELGRIIKFRGMTVALINDSGYSKTTSKHIWSAWHSVEHMPRVKIDGDFSSGCIERGLIREQGKLVDVLFDHFKRLSFGTWQKQWNVKDSYGDVGGYAKDVETFNAKARQLGFPKLCLDLNQEYIDLYNEKLVHGIERETDRNLERQARLEAARALEAKNAVEAAKAWRMGGPLVSSMYSIRPMILRVKNDRVETSGGASVSLKDAKELLRLAEKRALKQGDSVGEYTFERFDKNVLVIDCHRIAISELKDVVGSTQSHLKLVGGE